MSLTFEPSIPLALWLPLALAAAGLVAAYAITSRRRIAAGRWGIVVALMALAAVLPLVQSDLGRDRSASRRQTASHGARRRVGQHGDNR